MLTNARSFRRGALHAGRHLAGDGALEFSAGGPTDAATQRVFGLAVSLVPGLLTGTGIVLVRNCVSVVLDSLGVQTLWDPFTAFASNQGDVPRGVQDRSSK